MRSKWAATILGGLFLSSLLLLFLAQVILAKTLEPPHQFSGKVTIGDAAAAQGVEVRVRIRDQGKLLTLDLTARSNGSTDANGIYGQTKFFVVPAETADEGQELLFFLVTEPGTGEATTQAPRVLDSGKTVGISLDPISPRFTQGKPFPVNIVINAGSQPVSRAAAYLNFDPTLLDVVSITPGPTLTSVGASSVDNTQGTLAFVATGGAATGDFTLAVVNFRSKGPVKETSVSFNTASPRKTGSEAPGGAAVLRSVAGVDLEDVVVRAVTEIETEVSKRIGPVFFEAGGLTRVNLAIFGVPRNLDVKPDSPSNDPRPTFTWDSPGTSDLTRDVIRYEVRIIPGQQQFITADSLGNPITATTFTPDFDVPDGLSTFQVRAVGTGDRKDAIASLDFFIDTLAPGAPNAGQKVNEVTAGAESERIFTWTPAIDPGFPQTGSGVAFYIIDIRGPDNVLATADEGDICTAGLCTFTTPSLRSGSYTIRVSAVDEAGNQGPFTPALDFRAGRLDVVQGLAAVDPSVDNTFITANPKFRWSPPVVLPNSGDLLRGGIDTYEVALTGDIQGSPFTVIAPTSFTNPQFFQVECSRSTGDGTETATGDACKRFIGSGTSYRSR